MTRLHGSGESMRRFRIVARAAGAALLLALGAPAPARADDPVAALAAVSGTLDEWNIAVTSGAAAGYVPDATCALCHDDKAQSFKAMGMAKSFYRPSPEKIIEDFENNHYYNAATGRHYEMELRGEEYWFRRYQVADDGVRINLFEQKVDWILGSGHHTRVYLYRTNDGMMFQLPLAWYTREGVWRMGPGFETLPHPGLQRTVRRQCMFCHNAFPEVEAGSDAYAMPEHFPQDLPQGIGCQRCHGPGAEHAGLALQGEAPLEDIRAAIVNPSRLPREELYSICYGCHMQPIVAVPAVRRFGRDAYSFRPGEKLTDFIAQMDVEAANRPRPERFEINHHPYRLEQSACFIKSEGKLGCLTCHDPHVKIPPEARAGHYHAACLTCHEADDAGQPRMSPAQTSHPVIAADADCTTCHMPARRTQDVIEVIMTDHKIVRDPGSADLTAPIAKESTEVAEVFLQDPHHGLDADEQVIYKATAVLRHTSGGADYAADTLAARLEATADPHFEPWLEVARSQIRRGQFDAGLDTLMQAELRKPGHPKILEYRAVATFSKGNTTRAITLVRQLLEKFPKLAGQRFILAEMLHRAGNDDEATAQARHALEDRHTLWPAWHLLGELARTRGEPEQAAAAFKTALAIHPDAAASQEALVATLIGLGRPAEAARYRRRTAEP